MLKKSFTICLFYLVNFTAYSQAMDNIASFRMSDADHYIRFHYENDFFSSSDEYYTQGMNLEFVAPALKQNPMNRLMILTKEGTHQFGVAIEHNAYTPTSIRSNNILYGDRPFAASVFMKTFSASNHATIRYRVFSGLSLGIIGKAAGAYEIQKSIHQWTNGTDPKGWKYQIKNDVIINYEVGLEKNVIHLNHFLINGYGLARLGTLSTKVSTGVTIMIGKLNASITSVFSGRSIEKQRFTFQLYAQPLVNAVLYDATLQGGLVFNRDSPYTLSPKEIERLTIQGNSGVVFWIGSFYFEYFRSVITREFKSGHSHGSGGIKIGVVW